MLVTARPSPVPENSTLTVVVDADAAGAIFGTSLADRAGACPRLLDRISGEGPLSFGAAGAPKSFVRGAIHPAAFELALLSRSTRGVVSAMDGFKAISLILGAREGSRTTSFNVTLIEPIS